MHRLRGFTICLMLVLLTVESADGGQPAATSLSESIDKYLASEWRQANVQPARICDDATFLRRVSLDLIGRIPTIADTRAFLADTSADKRERCVSRLLDSPAHARHWATFWRRTWIPQADTPQFPVLAGGFERWLETELQASTPYDQVVTKLLLAPNSNQPGAAVDAGAFLSASEFKPENLAANTTRAFLGINLDCAQCHDHPFARWTRDQFWETAAFFARPRASETLPTQLLLKIPNTDRTIGPKLLIDPQPGWPETLQDSTGRTILARWVTAKDNPYFARNAVNRVWADLFGTGLIEPLDDLSGENPAGHPKLLDELARSFADGGFDLKSLTKAIVLSRAYQSASIVPQDQAETEPQLFARSAVRGLSGEQLYDSLRVAAGLSPERDDLDPLQALRQRKRFVEQFRVERAGTAQRSILQALSLMNGNVTFELTDLATAPTLRTVARAPFLDAQGKVAVLYLAALSREPTADESTQLVKYITGGGSGGNAQQALADVFWALINSSEFNTNH